MENSGPALLLIALAFPNLHLLFLYDCPNTQIFEASKFANLQALGFVNCKISHPFSNVVLPSLQTLTMECCCLEDETLVAISHTCPALESCDLQGNIGLTDDSVLKLVKNCSKLGALCLFSCFEVTTELKHSLSRLGLSIEDQL
jgi:hypothetical protein